MRPVGSVGREVRSGRDEETSLFRPFGEGRGVLAGVGVGRAVGQRVRRALRQDEHGAPGVLNVDRGAVGAGDRGARQDEVDVGVVGGHDHSPVVEAAGHDVGAGGGDGDGRPVRAVDGDVVGCAARDIHRVAGGGDGRGGLR